MAFMKYRSLLLFFLVLCNYSFSQELPNVIPLSPNAASIVKYGEIPVGHFTGVPSIEVPLYTIQSGELSLPLFLSYHAGGNKVESVASWVGLGWSLNSIPSISRTVRGIPDEKNGYFYKYQGLTVEQLWALDESTSTMQSYRADLYNGLADSEPDIFSYSLSGESGKFFYNQEEDEFITFPKSNLRITRNGNVFTLVNQSGVKFQFDIRETIPSGTSGSTTTTWYASSMMSASNKDTINFTYSSESHIQKVKSMVTKYHYLDGLLNGFPADNGSILTTNVTSAKVIDKITFKNGYVKFNKNTGAYRADLNGSYSLNNVSVHNHNDELVAKHKFSYSFKPGTGSRGAGSACYNADSFSSNWMLLDKVEQVSTTNASETLPHIFEYNDSYFPACRYSAGQDYWGFYNGSDSNSDLIPPYFIPNTSNQVAGADRSVNPNFSDYGVLTKITYPTGGYTTFEFENNMAFANDLQPEYTTESKVMAGDDYFDAEEELPVTNSFQKTFTINNPQDPYLNNNNPNGGGNVSFQILFPGCNISGGSNPCALFTVTSSTNDVYHLHQPNTSFYLPNGTYTMKASFNQSPPNYNEFIFIVEWQRLLPGQSANRFTGGLRVKEIKSYANDNAQPIVKRYKYTKEYNSTESSGDVFGDPNFSHSEVISYQNSTPSLNGVTASTLFRVRSVSNIQQISHSGSYVGYSTIFEETNNVNETGYIEYNYSNQRDWIQASGFPYVPDQSRQLYRGQLLNQKISKWNEAEFDLVQEKNLTYDSTAFDNSTEHPKSSFAIKWGNLIVNEVNATFQIAQTMVGYYVYGGWNSVNIESTTNYFDSGHESTSVFYHYDNAKHLLPTRTRVVDSNGDYYVNSTKYPQDVTSPDQAVTQLINQNRLGEVVETVSFIDKNKNGVLNSGEKLSTELNQFKKWTSSIVKPEFLKTSKGANSLENRIAFHSYDDNGNIKEVSKADGTGIVYVWGYNSEYPIAKIENASYRTGQTNTITSAQQSLINNAVAATLNETSASTENNLRSKLELLRNGLPKALVTTYTYDPLVGVTSQTTPNGLTTYYEYDDFNRLSIMKDHNGKVLKKYEYKYQESISNTNN